MAGSLGTIMGQVRLDVRQAVAAYAALRAQNQRTVYAMRGTSEAMIATGRTMTVAGAAMVYAIGKVIMAAAEFERKMDFFAAVTDTNAAKMQRLSDFTLQLAQDTIYSADEIADGLIELGKAGVSAEQIMNGIGEAMANLGAAGDIPLAESGQIITSVIQQYDLAARDAVKVTDLLAGAANASIADITDIGVSLKYVGGVANAAGLSFEDTTTAISLLATAGIRGSTAGTSLRQMIVSLGGATGPAREALRELGILTGENNNKFFTAQGEAKSLSEVFQILQNATEDLTAKERLMALRTIFNNRALSAASILTREGAKGFRDMNREMSKTTAAEVASERLDNLSGDIEILKGNIQTLIIEAGGPFQKTMRKWVQGLTKLVQAFGDLEPETQEMVVQTFAITGVLLLVLGAFNLVLGVIFKFLAHLKRMGPAIRYISKLIWALWDGLKGFAKMLVGPVMAALTALAAALGISVGWLLAIIAIIAALVVGFIYAYKKIDAFREGIDLMIKTTWDAIKALGTFFKNLVTDPKKAWAQLKQGVGILREFAKRMAPVLKAGLRIAVAAIIEFVGDAVDWFGRMGRQALDKVKDFVSHVLSLMTLENLGRVLGFVARTLVDGFNRLKSIVGPIVSALVDRIAEWFAKLPTRVGYVIGFLIGFAVRLFLNMASKLIPLAIRVVVGIVRAFATLAARVIPFVARMVSGAITALIGFVRRSPQLIRQAVTAIVNFIKSLPERIPQLIDQMKSRALQIFKGFESESRGLGSTVVQAIVNGFKNLPSLIGNILQALPGLIGSFISAVISGIGQFSSALGRGFGDGLGNAADAILQFLGNIPGWFVSMGARVLSTVASFVSRVTSYLTFRNLGYVIGFVIGRVIRLFVGLQVRVSALVASLVVRVIGFFRRLPSRVGAMVLALVARVVRLFGNMAGRVLPLAARVVTGVINFFRKLPGRVIGFLARMVAGAVARAVALAQDLPRLAGQAADGVINFIKDLPEKVPQLVNQMKTKASQFLQQMVNKAIELGAGIYRGIVGAIQGLPSVVGGILQSCIDAFRDVLQNAFNAARDFAGGLVDGFRDGLGIGSPSQIERDMWQVTGTLDEETRRLARQTVNIQRMSKKLRDVDWGLGADGSSTAARYARLASMQAANRNRARTLAESVGNRSAARRMINRGGTGPQRRVDFVITNWRTGEGYFREIAQDVVDDNDYYDESVGRMG